MSKKRQEPVDDDDLFIVGYSYGDGRRGHSEPLSREEAERVKRAHEVEDSAGGRKAVIVRYDSDTGKIINGGKRR